MHTRGGHATATRIIISSRVIVANEFGTHKQSMKFLRKRKIRL